MTYKLATAAAMVLASATASNAADLAKKAPAAVDYVKVCDTYGAGFFYIPGSDTCLKIGGYVRVNIMGGDSDTVGASTPYYKAFYNGERPNNSMSTSVRFLLSTDARSMTEYGLLRAYSELEFNTKSGVAEGVDVGKAFIQWGGWSAGHKTSNFDYFTGYALGATYGIDAHDDTVNLLSYTFNLGNGVNATVGIEDPTYAARYNDGWAVASDQTATYNYVGTANSSVLLTGTITLTGTKSSASYGGVKAPDVVANINVTQAWGSAQIQGALHQAYGATEASDGGWGYAIGAGITINLPMLGAGDAIALQATYSDGAVRYVTDGLGDSFAASGETSTALGVYDFDATGKTSTAWGVAGGFKHVFSPSLSAAVDASYVVFEDATSGSGAAVANFDSTQWAVRGSVTWTPVTNLAISAGVDYKNTDYDNTALNDGSGWGAALRVQRNF